MLHFDTHSADWKFTPGSAKIDRASCDLLNQGLAHYTIKIRSETGGRWIPSFEIAKCEV
jgi:hypothetical protein